MVSFNVSIFFVKVSWKMQVGLSTKWKRKMHDGMGGGEDFPFPLLIVRYLSYAIGMLNEIVAKSDQNV